MRYRSNLKTFALAMALSSTLLSGTAFAADDSIDVAGPFEIKGADPSLSGNIFLAMDVAETLVNTDQDGHLTPGLAASWAVENDGLVWRFKMQDGATFHDGTPADAAAAANALNIARAKPGLLQRAPIDAIEADGADLVVKLAEPFAALPAFLAEYRSQILAPASYGADGMATSVIGSGAYKITLLQAPGKMEADRFDQYWGGPAKIGKATYNSVSRAETRALMAESGDADYVLNLDPASVARLKDKDGLDVRSVPIPRSLLVKVNAANPKLNTVEARKALSLAIDREGLAIAVLRYQAGATQLFPPSVGDWHNAALAPLAYDPEAAAALLAELGWKAGSDGILEKDGERFTLELLTYPDRPELPLVAAVLQQQLQEVGIELTINSTNSSEVPARHNDGSLELALLARNFALVPNPIGTLLQDYAPNGDWGAMNWQNAEIADLLKSIGRNGGSAEQFATATTILQEELPVLPIAWYQQNAAISGKLQGAILDPYERKLGLKDASWKN